MGKHGRWAIETLGPWVLLVVAQVGVFWIVSQAIQGCTTTTPTGDIAVDAAGGTDQSQSQPPDLAMTPDLTQPPPAPDLGPSQINVSGCTATPSSVMTNEPVTLFANVTGCEGGCACSHDCGNGQGGPGRQAECVYSSGGRFTATIGCVNGLGQSDSCSATIDVEPREPMQTPAPMPTATATPPSTMSTLTVVKPVPNGCLVFSNPGGISCGLSCAGQSAMYPRNSNVTLFMSLASGHSCAGWGGAPNCTGCSCVVTMDSDKLISANCPPSG